MAFLQKLLTTAVVAMPFAFVSMACATWFFRKTGIRGWSAGLIACVGGGVVSGLVAGAVGSVFPEHSAFLAPIVVNGVVLGTGVGGLGAMFGRSPDNARNELAEVLREARSLLALPDNDFCWSSWPDAEAALAEVDGMIATLEAGGLPSRERVSLLFAPTGPVQEVSISSGWGEEYLVVAARCDAALAACPS